MKTLLLTCDFEEFSLPIDFGKKISEELMLEKSYEGIQRLIELIKNHQIKLTFFVSERMAKFSPNLLRELVTGGHEIGLHVYIDYKKDNDTDKIIDRIKYIKEEIEEDIRTKIYGFRNHKLIVVPPYILKEAGFVYDNTCHPTYVPGRYFYLLKSRKIKLKYGIINIPISVTPIFRLPFSWIWFRNLGLNYVKLCTSWVFLNQDWVNIYLHSWDFTDLNDNLPFKLPYFITSNAGWKMIRMLDNYLNFCKLNQIRISTIYNYLRENNFIGGN